MLNHIKKDIENFFQDVVKGLGTEDKSIPPILLDIPNEKQHGDFSSNMAFQLSRLLRQKPLSIAEKLCGMLENKLLGSPLQQKIKKVEVKGPGFINFFLSQEAFWEVLEDILTHPQSFWKTSYREGQRIQIEFVSANPTGPLSVAHARQAAVGDALANILAANGAKVTKEYYVNDEGNQIVLLGESIKCRALEIFGKDVSLPENGYQGEYVREMAQIFIKERNLKNISDVESTSTKDFSDFGVRYLLELIQKELTDFNVAFDVWTRQSKVADEESIRQCLEELKGKQLVYEKDGALWFKSTDFGDDKDRVVRKSDGTYTYLAPDIVYHKDKFERGFTHLINIWGPDHHGYISRLKAAVQALGHDADSLTVLIVQLATIYRDGQPLSMSTRKGQYISLREVIEEVGVDAARFFFLMRHIENHLDFDLELAKKETPENPVYYVQYAHARINSVIRLASERQLMPTHTAFPSLREEEEIDLIRKMGFFPNILETCARQNDPFALVNYLQELATVFHKFYDKHRIIGDDQDLSSQRLGLIEACKMVLAKGLSLLGVSAPERM